VGYLCAGAIVRVYRIYFEDVAVRNPDETPVKESFGVWTELSHATMGRGLGSVPDGRTYFSDGRWMVGGEEKKDDAEDVTGE